MFLFFFFLGGGGGGGGVEREEMFYVLDLYIVYYSKCLRIKIT